ncbi:hypothetical protein SteCoe_1639 [Stentor coeruleus]|uniref:Protein-serine/threonine phosphatase n=1 Tax=Stentor coeruleus TaxID=5963 RepID=A0A1R2D1H3_9CILI|nr:hypothetical protein SteCoe_1639 [Stentor coeruleus]
MKNNIHIQALREAWEKLPITEKDDYSIFNSVDMPSRPTNNKDPSPENQTRKKHRNSLYVLRCNILDEPVTTPDIFGVMSEISLSFLPQNSEIEYSIFISDIQAANDLGILRNNQINSVLTLGMNKPLTYPTIKGGYRCISLEDNNSADLLKILPEIYNFINSQLEKGNVLVHCLRGKNRSCAAVVGYLIKKYSLVYEEALEIVRRSRPFCEINENFARQLSGMRRKGSL